WKINLWARLLDGDRAHKLLSDQLQKSTLPNLWDSHPPFQIDCNFGATAGMAGMLLQSQNNEIHLLPALPAAWPSGSVKGLRARGEVNIELTWNQRDLTSAVIARNLSSDIRLRTSSFQKKCTLVKASNGEPVSLKGAGATRTFAAQAGE